MPHMILLDRSSINDGILLCLCIICSLYKPIFKIANSLLLIFFYLIPLYLAELLSYRFVLGLLLKHISVCGNKNIFQKQDNEK